MLDKFWIQFGENSAPLALKLYQAPDEFKTGKVILGGRKRQRGLLYKVLKYFPVNMEAIAVKLSSGNRLRYEFPIKKGEWDDALDLMRETGVIPIPTRSHGRRMR